jgi:hypothetical protein
MQVVVGEVVEFELWVVKKSGYEQTGVKGDFTAVESFMMLSTLEQHEKK